MWNNSNFDDGNLTEISERFNRISISLQEANFPLHGGLLDVHFPENLRKDAQQLHCQLDDILRKFDNFETSSPANASSRLIELLEKLIAGSKRFDDYKKSLKLFDFSSKCNAVWLTDCIAYRCSTCAFNPCMSLCSNCFLDGDHEGHDFTRFFSLCGGACDCGHDDVLDVKGFCRRHARNCTRTDAPPIELCALSEYIFVKLFTRLLNKFRGWRRRFEKHQRGAQMFLQYRSTPKIVVSEAAYNDAAHLVDAIRHFTEQGSPTTNIIVKILLSDSLYEALNAAAENEMHFDGDCVAPLPSEPTMGLGATRALLREDIDSLTTFEFPASFTGSSIGARIAKLVAQNECKITGDAFKCLFDELFFYMTRLYFPQQLINILLCLLPIDDYKERFARKYFGYYAQIAALILNLVEDVPVNSNEISDVTNRIIHISVQVCSSQKICQMLAEKILVIDKVLNTGLKILCNATAQLELNNSLFTFFTKSAAKADIPVYFTTNIMDNSFISRYGSAFFFTDFQNIFEHVNLSRILVNSEQLCAKYVTFISLLQCDFVIWRVVSGNHVEHERTALANRAFSLEWEMSSSIMFSVFGALETPECRRTDCAIINVIGSLFDALKNFFRCAQLTNGLARHQLQAQPYAVSYQLPLHRHLAYVFWLTLKMIGEDNGAETREYIQVMDRFIADEKEFLQLCVIHSLRIQVVRSEQYAGMWARNGLTLRTCVNIYDRNAYTLGMQNLDLFLLRFCSANVDQEFFLNSLYYSFHLYDCERLSTTNTTGLDDSKFIITSNAWTSHMRDGFLRLLLNMVALKAYVGASTDACLRAEMVCTLAYDQMPHSRLRNAIPERAINSTKDFAHFDDILAEIADYQEPDQGEHICQGRYKLKNAVALDEFDPIFTRLRSVSLTDYNNSLRRAEEDELAYLRRTRPTDEKLPTHLWIRYRLIDFDSEPHYRSFDGSWALLTQPSFFFIIHNILKATLNENDEQEIFLQQVIYLLTLSVNFVSSKAFAGPFVQRQLYHKTNGIEQQPSDLIKSAFHETEIRDLPDCQQQREAILANFTLPIDDISNQEKTSLFLLILKCLNRCYIKPADMKFTPAETNEDSVSKSECSFSAEMFSHLMQSCTNRTAESWVRLYGGTSRDYIERLVVCLYKSDAKVRQLIDGMYEEHVLKKTENVFQLIDLGNSDDSKFASGICFSSTTELNKTQLLERRKRSKMLLEAQRQKHARLMKTMMKQENITQAEMDEMDTTSVGVDENKLCSVVYECPICDNPSTCTITNLVGLFVHIQPNRLLDSVLEANEPIVSLMDIGNDQSGRLINRNRRVNYVEKRRKTMYQIYSRKSRFSQFDCAVNVRTCGHTAHLGCFKAYVETLNSTQRHPAFPGERVYSCPMCRQPINDIMPLKPEIGCEKRRIGLSATDFQKNYSCLARNLLQCVISRTIPRSHNPELFTYINSFDEFQQNCRWLCYPLTTEVFGESTKVDHQTKTDLYNQFLLGIARYNIDYQLLLRQRGLLPNQRNRKLEILKHIMYKIRVGHEIYLDSAIEAEAAKLIGNSYKELPSESMDDEVPIAFYDECSLISLFCAYILTNETYVDADKFALCKYVYSISTCLVLFKSITHTFLSIPLTTALRISAGDFFTTNASRLFSNRENGSLANALDSMCKIVYERLDAFFKRLETYNIGELSEEDLALSAAGTIVKLCETNGVYLARFFTVLMDEHELGLRIDANIALSDKMLKEGENNVEEVDIFNMDFIAFYEMIERSSTRIVPMHSSVGHSESKALFNFIALAKDTIDEWSHCLDRETEKRSNELKESLHENVLIWHKPMLLTLPHSYDDLFSRFFGAKCSSCSTSLASPMICLVCGALCCLRDCRARQRATDSYRNRIGNSETELELHSNKCCFGGCCFLSLSSSLVIIVRNKQAINWGSVYLDSYGEEDRNLRRGKPLFLSTYRFRRLEEDWLRQTFLRRDSPNGSYSWLSIDQLTQFLREVHNY